MTRKSEVAAVSVFATLPVAGVDAGAVAVASGGAFRGRTGDGAVVHARSLGFAALGRRLLGARQLEAVCLVFEIVA